MYQEIKGKQIKAFVGSTGNVVFKVLGNDNKWCVFETTCIQDATGTPMFKTAHKQIVTWSDVISEPLAGRTARRHALALKTGKRISELK